MTEIALAILSIVGTLGGVVLGSRLDHRRWLRDKRLEAYGVYGAAINAWLLAFTHRDVEDLAALADPINELAIKLQTVWLLAPRDTAEAADEVLNKIVAAYTVMTRKSDGSVGMRAENAVISQAITEAGGALMRLQVRDLNGRLPRLRQAYAGPGRGHR